ncbi:hypothetical protein N7447_002768 [Penicillium robsamsonii]|uniref:uncharacterized protein n=1 Tax=Penicillium robsamsonii TaxID=1792511 RepID=UPI002548BFB9|nr:uncharacterized protein N7447_002768 [Penicillium robsamsonii]KAJ5836742.1 hypothetical protein N7447_002768 [Penicillium robsamsonii]
MSEPSDPVSPATSHHSAPVPLQSVPVSFPSKAPRVHHLPVLKADLKKVAASRGNVHARKVAILIRWENDTTGAEQDIITMGKVMETFNIQYTDHILKATDLTPYWNLSDKIRKMIVDCCNSKQHSLFVFYYVGHGAIVDGGLHFIQDGKLIAWSDLRADFFSERDAVRHVDVLGVVDCCYSGAATRTQASRVTQVMAACGPNEGTSLRGQKASFTMRLFHAVQHFKGQSSVSTAALFQEIQRQKPRNAPNAVFETLSGTRPIRLVFNDHTPSSRIPRPSPHVNEKHVLVKLTLHGHSQTRGHSDVLESFKNAIQDLPLSMKVEISDAYETDQSIFLIMGMSWEAWSLWTMVAHLDFVGVTLGPSLMPRRLVEVPVPVSDENRHPSSDENRHPSHGKGKAE